MGVDRGAEGADRDIFQACERGVEAPQESLIADKQPKRDEDGEADALDYFDHGVCVPVRPRGFGTTRARAHHVEVCYMMVILLLCDTAYWFVASRLAIATRALRRVRA